MTSLEAPKRPLLVGELEEWLITVDESYVSYGALLLEHKIDNSHKLARVVREALVGIGIPTGKLYCVPCTVYRVSVEGLCLLQL